MKTNDEIYNEIKGKFEDCPDLPESLSKENVVAILKDTKQKKTSRITLNKIGSVAAVLVLALLCALTANFAFGDMIEIKLNDEDNKPEYIQENALAATQNSEAQKETAVPEKLPEGIRKAQSREEIEKIILKNYTKYDKYYFFDAIADGVDMTVGVTAAPGSATGSASDTNSFNNSTSREELKQYGETNTQTKGVDEADIIKNDGRYLYVVGYDLSSNRKLRIIDTETMTVVYNGYLYNDSGDILDISEIYVSGNTLVAVGTYGNYYGYGCFVDGYGGIGGKTVSVVMDITDRSSPKTLRKVEQDGSYRSSRMVGGVLYTLTEYTVSGKDEEEAKTNSVPEVAGAEIKCDCIYIIDEDSSRYICLTAYDTATADGVVSSLAVLGRGGEVYCSENTLYVIGNKYVNLKKVKEKNSDTDNYSVISAFSLKGTNIAFKAQGEVPGYINNQYNLDEYQGNLRIATTAYSTKKNADVSSLYILGGDMKIIGKVENIADDEQIKSVRYMGDKAYVVTFRNTDPLFVIDLKDPKNPVIKGELKLPGYSAYMHPLSENIILGIGYNGDSQNADFTSLKVSLFDVSDMANPKEISYLTYNDCYSYVVDNPKAFIYNSEENYMVLPLQKYSTYNYELSGYNCYIVSVKNNKLTLEYDLKHNVQDVYSGITFLRGTYIGDEFFTVSDNLTVKHSLKTGEKLGECKIYEEGKKLEVTTAVATEINSDTKSTVTATTQTTPAYNPNK